MSFERVGQQGDALMAVLFFLLKVHSPLRAGMVYCNLLWFTIFSYYTVILEL